MATQAVSAPRQHWIRVIPVAFLMYTIATGTTLTGIVVLCISLVVAGLMTIVFRYEYPRPVGMPEMPGASTEESGLRTVPADRHRAAS